MKKAVIMKSLGSLLAVSMLCCLLAGCGADGDANVSGGSESGSADNGGGSGAAGQGSASVGAAGGSGNGGGQDAGAGSPESSGAADSGDKLPNIMENPAYSAMDRQVLTIGITVPNRETLEIIQAFNEASPSYFLEVKNYYVGLDAEAAARLDSQLSLDILSGEGPDLMLWDSSFYTPALVSGRLMVDLKECMDGDPDFNREDYLENILEAFEIDGGLYLFPASFTVYHFVGKAEELGADRGVVESWEFGEMLKAYESSPHAEMFSSVPNKEYTLEYACRNCMDLFVDWGSGECHFETPEFVELLELSNTFPDGFDNVPVSFQEAYSSGEIFLCTVNTLCEPWSMADARAYFGDADLRWPGSPVPAGEKELGGGVAKPWGACLSICKGGSSQEAAWEVIKGFLTEDMQRKSIGNPILRSVFEEKLQDALTVEYQTVSGVEQEKIRYEVVLSERGDSVGFSCISEEDAEIYRRIIENTHRSYYSDMVMWKIILEEAGVYFAGDRDAAATAVAIQDSIGGYVAEHRK